MTTLAERRAAFRALHADGCFLLPNPWDADSARRMAALGAVALASTSSGAAEAAGKRDGELSVDEVLAHLRDLVDASDLPVNADFEGGFADAPEAVAANVSRAIGTGIAGLSIEDRAGRSLHPFDLAVERVAAARRAIDASGEDVVLVARTEGFLLGHAELAPTLERMVAMAGAGADCLYAPGLQAPAHIEALVAAVAPKPVNVLLWGPEMTVAGLGALGVRRVSTGGALARRGADALEPALRALLSGGGLPD